MSPVASSLVPSLGQNLARKGYCDAQFGHIFSACPVLARLTIAGPRCELASATDVSTGSSLWPSNGQNDDNSRVSKPHIGHLLTMCNSDYRKIRSTKPAAFSLRQTTREEYQRFTAGYKTLFLQPCEQVILYEASKSTVCSGDRGNR